MTLKLLLTIDKQHQEAIMCACQLGMPACNDCQNEEQCVVLYAGCVEAYIDCDVNQSNTALTADGE